MPIPEGYHPEMKKMIQLPLGSNSIVAIIGDAELEKTTAALLDETFHCTVKIYDENGNMWPDNADLLIINSKRSVPVFEPSNIHYLMVRTYGVAPTESPYGDMIWSEDFWTLWERKPDNISYTESSVEQSIEEETDGKTSGEEAPQAEGEVDPSCPDCDYTVPKGVKDIKRSLKRHSREHSKIIE